MLKIYKSISLMLVVLCLLLLCVNEAPANKAKTLPDVSLTLIPPSPVTDKITLYQSWATNTISHLTTFGHRTTGRFK